MKKLGWVLGFFCLAALAEEPAPVPATPGWEISFPICADEDLKFFPEKVKSITYPGSKDRPLISMVFDYPTSFFDLGAGTWFQTSSGMPSGGVLPLTRDCPGYDPRGPATPGGLKFVVNVNGVKPEAKPIAQISGFTDNTRTVRLKARGAIRLETNVPTFTRPSTGPTPNPYPALPARVVGLRLLVASGENHWDIVKEVRPDVVINQTMNVSLEADVPANRPVRVQMVFFADELGKRNLGDFFGHMEDFRLFGARCYPDQAVPGKCLGDR